MGKENTKSEKCEAKSGTVLKSKNKAFKLIQIGVELVLSSIGDLSLKYYLQSDWKGFFLNADHILWGAAWEPRLM